MQKILSVILVTVLFFTLTSSPGYAAASLSPQDLEEYLTEVDMTQTELEEYLDYYGVELEEFSSINELRDMLGPALTPASLEDLLHEYDMTEEELTALLIEYGEMEEGKTILDSFYFVSDIEMLILFDQDMGDIDWTELLDGLSTEFDMNEEELERLFTHLEPIFEQPEFEDQLMTLANRMLQFEEFETLDELTAEQVAELFSIYDDLQNLLQVQFKFALIKDGVTTPISIKELYSIEELENASLVIAIHDLNGNLLLDFILTGEMFSSDLVKEAGQDLKEAPKVIEEVKSEASKTVPKTIKGGLLPQTAGNYLLHSIAGLLIIGLAFVLFKRARMN
ncbi:processed acidic surface protein [Peribacillus asahii]|uniref:processed acidic surface protein n=1 Tax=Peribacillus asahii TaxID=228899 RepID=UPI00207A76CC|nr:processed acidic surface protein [Peribacillus asahii]USK69918.1 processed acidic surface protein [Peribacillus asahii]